MFGVVDMVLGLLGGKVVCGFGVIVAPFRLRIFAVWFLLKPSDFSDWLAVIVLEF